MFEKFTEASRRVVFFAFYESCLFGSERIESEHLLLGVIREDANSGSLTFKGLLNSDLRDTIRKEIEQRVTLGKKVYDGLNILFSDESKRIIRHAAEEAESFNHPYIGIQHLLLGILREEKCLAAIILSGHGFQLTSVRENVTIM